MLGKFWQVVARIGIQSQLYHSVERYKCITSYASDIKNNLSAYCTRPIYNRQFNSFDKNDAERDIQDKIKIKSKSGTNNTIKGAFKVETDLRTPVNDAKLSVSSLEKVNPNDNKDIPDASDFRFLLLKETECEEKTPYNELVAQKCITRNNFSDVGLEGIKKKSLEHCSISSTSYADSYEKGTSIPNDKIIQTKYVFLEPCTVKVVYNRSFHTLLGSFKNEDKREQIETLEKQEHKIVPEHGKYVQGKTNIVDFIKEKASQYKYDAGRETYSAGNVAKNVSQELQAAKQVKNDSFELKQLSELNFKMKPFLQVKNSQYVHAFHPLNADVDRPDVISDMVGEIKQPKSNNLGEYRIDKGLHKGYGTIHSNELYNPERIGYKLALNAKSPADIDMRNSYSTVCDDSANVDVRRKSEKGCLGEFERKDSRTSLPDRCLSKRSMSSIEQPVVSVEKGDPSTSKSLELKAKKKKKKKKKGKKKPKKKKKKKKKPKKKKKKKVCGSDQSSKISCLDVCYTRKPCAAKPKARKKTKPQKCLKIGCGRGLKGLCAKISTIFQRDRKCKIKKGKR